VALIRLFGMTRSIALLLRTDDRGGKSCWFEVYNSTSGRTPVLGHGRKTNHVRGDVSFPRKRSPDAGDGCTADPLTTGFCYWRQNLIQLRTLVPGDPGICKGPILLQKSFCTADQKFSGL
jgi:hypothetical protein